MNILILGSEGFIGRHCVSYYQQKGWEVYGCDLVDYASGDYNYVKISRLNPDFDGMFSLARYDVCLNAAGNGSVPISIDHPLTDFEANCGDVIGVLELIRKLDYPCKYLHFSSAAVYGNPMELPIAENHPLTPLSPYGWHKQISELLCREYYHLYNIPVAILRPFSIYGPGLRKQLFWDIYKKLLADPHELTLWGTGEESRDFIYIDDVLEAVDIVLNKSPMQANVYNVASGIETTIGKAAQVFVANFNNTTKISFNNKVRAGDPVNWKADITAISQLGFKHKVSIPDGIFNYVQWLKLNQ